MKKSAGITRIRQTNQGNATAYAARRIDIGATRPQQLHYLQIPTLCGGRQRCVVVLQQQTNAQEELSKHVRTQHNTTTQQ